MRTLLIILGVIALLLVLGGAVNHGTEVSLDYVAGSTDAVSLFWAALVTAAALLLAGVAGWAVGRGGDAGARRKLEKELEGTYRRLRQCEAKLPRTADAPVVEAATVVAATPVEAATVVTPAPVEETTAIVPVPAEDVTAVAPGPAEDATAVAPQAEDGGATAEPDANAGTGPVPSEPAGEAPAGDDPTTS